MQILVFGQTSFENHHYEKSENMSTWKKTSLYICQLDCLLGMKLCPRQNFHNGFCDDKTKESGTHFSQLNSMNGGPKESLSFGAFCTLGLRTYIYID